MKKLLIVLLLFFAIFGIEQARADTQISTVNITKSIFKDYGNKQRIIAFEYVGSLGGNINIYDENGNILNQVITPTTGASILKYANSRFLEIDNGDVLIILDTGIGSNTTSYNTSWYFLYNATNDNIVDLGVFTGYELVTVTSLGTFGAIVDNHFIFRTMGTDGVDLIDHNGYGTQKINLDTYVITPYVGNLLTTDLKYMYANGKFSQISNSEFIFKENNFLYGKQCTEDFGGLCENFVNRIELTGTGETIQGFDVGTNGIDTTFLSVVYTDDLGDIQFYSNVIQNGFNDFFDIYIQRFDYVTNEAYGLQESILSQFEFIPEYILNPNIFIIDYNSSAYYSYRTGQDIFLHGTSDLFDDTAGVGETGGTGGTGGTGDIEYDDSIWDFDLDGDGEVGLLNGEIFTALGNMFKYLFNLLLDFFANIKDFISQFNDIFTNEVKTFSFFPQTYANSITDAMHGVDQEELNNNMLGKVMGFYKGLAIFFVFILGLVIFISVNKNKNG